MSKHCECTSPICDCRNVRHLAQGAQCPAPAFAKVGISLLCRVCTAFAQSLGLQAQVLPEE